MRDLLSEEYESVAASGADRLIPGSVRKLAGAAVFLGVVGAMGLWSYRLGTRDATEVPVIRAMAGPARLAPENPGGSQAAHQGLEVNAVLAGRPAPVPGGAEAAAVAAPALADEDATPPVLRTEPVPEAVADTGAPELIAAPGAVAEIPAADLPPDDTNSIQAEVAAMVAAVVPSEPAAPAGEAVAAERPRGRPSNLVTARASVSDAVAKPAATATPAAGIREISTPGAGARMVQLGAYDSEALARDAWRRMVGAEGDLLSSKSLYIERATSNARVFYRLRVAGFDDAEETRKMCEALRSRGVDCIPVTLR